MKICRALIADEERQPEALALSLASVFLRDTARNRRSHRNLRLFRHFRHCGGGRRALFENTRRNSIRNTPEARRDVGGSARNTPENRHKSMKSIDHYHRR